METRINLKRFGCVSGAKKTIWFKGKVTRIDKINDTEADDSMTKIKLGLLESSPAI